MLDQENDLSLASGFEHSSKNKDLRETNSPVDSGFISGPQAIYSGELDDSEDQLESEEKHHHYHHQLSHNDTYTDSGCIDDSTHLTLRDKHNQTHIDTNTDSGIMISGGSVGEAVLANRLNNLSLNKIHNDLDAAKEKINQQKNLWKTCYRQDNEGDT